MDTPRIDGTCLDTVSIDRGLARRNDIAKIDPDTGRHPTNPEAEVVESAPLSIGNGVAVIHPEHAGATQNFEKLLAARLPRGSMDEFRPHQIHRRAVAL